MSFDISAVVNLHAEGYLCGPSLTNINRCVEYARSRGLTAETIVVLDCSDVRTLGVIQKHKREDWRIFQIAERDLGKARNYAVGKANGELISFLDGDDLWCEDWLTLCVNAASHSTRRTIWHPELNLYFGAESRIFRHIDMESDEFDLLDLLFSNLWTALVCTHRSNLLEIPYPDTDLKRQIGYEDWGWNLRTIEAGLVHKIIPGAAHAVRVKPNHLSLAYQSASAGVVPASSKVFRSLLRRLPASREYRHME